MTLSSEEKSKRCVVCQKCCRRMRFPLPVDYIYNKDTLEFLKVRGVDIIESMEGGRRMTWASLRVDCPHITYMGCDIYPVRPKVCRIFDGSRDFEIGQDCEWNR